jgi:hypothetical protein
MGRDTRPITPDTFNDNDRHYFTVLSEILVSFWSIYQLTFDGSLNKRDNRTVSVPLIFSLYLYTLAPLHKKPFFIAPAVQSDYL